jgi:iron complex outermembrane receptor protein
MNGTTTGGLDLSGFYAEKYGKLGVTLFTSRNSSAAYDPDHTGLSSIPKFQRYTFTPRLYFYSNKTQANIGISYITENRLGGSMDFIGHGTPGYFEQNNSRRFTTQLGITRQTGTHSTLSFKNSFNHFSRNLTIPDYQFEGLQQSSFSELSWSSGSAKSTWVLGTNLYTDNFKENQRSTDPLRNYSHSTLGTFVQNTWSPSSEISVESGLRGDYTSPYGFVLLPKMSFLFHLSDDLTSRIGGGLGYKLPTIFTEQSEEQQFQGIQPIDEQQTAYERSSGANLDFTWKTFWDDLRLTLNPLFFYTRINHPLVLQKNASDKDVFANADGYTDSKGIDVTVRMALDHFTFFTGYSYTEAQNHFSGIKSWYPLAPHHRLHFDLVYEIEGQLRIAFESYYTGKQQLSDGTLGKPYWLLGALVEKSWKHFSLFLNSEDLNNVCQTAWGPIYSGGLSNPSFKEIYAPLEGTTINGGIKIKL